MNPIGLCATDAKSLVAVIKAAQKAGIKSIIITREAFDDWWWPLQNKTSEKYLKIKMWFRNLEHCHWVGDSSTNLCIKIWPADMNPKGF